MQYHKIQTIYKRDPENKFKTLLEGEYSLPEFEYLKDNEWVFTEKVDGTNIRIMWDGENITFGGKTDKAQIPADLVNRLSYIFKDSKFLNIFGDEGSVCLYGEGYGAKIQKGGGNYHPDGVDFVLFDIRIGNFWLQRDNIKEIAKQLNLEVVPIIGKGTLEDAVKMTRRGFNSQWGEFTAEGLVLRPVIELLARNGDRIITKIKHKDFI